MNGGGCLLPVTGEVLLYLQKNVRMECFQFHPAQTLTFQAISKN